MIQIQLKCFFFEEINVIEKLLGKLQKEREYPNNKAWGEKRNQQQNTMKSKQSLGNIFKTYIT